jgi:hypothetical protein
VARHLEQGAPINTVPRLLAREFPNESAATLKALASRGLLSWQLGQQMQAWEPAYPVTEDLLPDIGTTPVGIRVGVNVLYYDPVSKVESWTTAKPVFSSIPDKQTLLDTIDQFFADVLASESEIEETPELLGKPVVLDTEIYNVEWV